MRTNGLTFLPVLRDQLPPFSSSYRDLLVAAILKKYGVPSLLTVFAFHWAILMQIIFIHRVRHQLHPKIYIIAADASLPEVCKSGVFI
jgi:hypothetical protein